VLIFQSSIFKEGINYLVAVPEEISMELGKPGYIPVKGFVDHVAFKSTCVPRRGKRHVIFLNSAIRKKIQKTENDGVTLQIEYDHESREIPVPEDIELILAEKSVLLEEFWQLSTAHRNELIRWIQDAKRPETRLKRIEILIQHLHERRKKRIGY
jgi:hypothetical protein